MATGAGRVENRQPIAEGRTYLWPPLSDSDDIRHRDADSGLSILPGL